MQNKIRNLGRRSKRIGFFCQINDDAIPFKKALFTSSHILNIKRIDINKEIILNFVKKK